ncbi:aspartate aminotransferase family protein [Roseovarius sp. SCSIO 43702]|uniref:aspartate aminotransferase family protein n=1 Tax=Roseovarius sp. SCSIO 43702 TaxID=2823043 RepID=UPI001C73DBA3|nr:aspartate aminotransferase family protein [Roseovarius sp. SCSIO 43702]QYX55744.1 aspartate aminotransferase family protein [Roseovarius sp. SCSIO 43702]
MALYDRDRAVISGLEKLRFFPVALVGGEGAHLIEEGGRRLLDLSAGWGAASLGYAHPAIREAVAGALSSQAGATLLSTTNAPAVALAETLLEITPGEGERRVWLGHSGSDANETAMRAVRAATGRERIMAFHGAYHGGTQGSMEISGHSAQEGVTKSAGLTLVPYPDPYRPYEGDATGEAILAHVRALLEGEVPGREVAAFFIEPIQADGGLIVPPEGFLRKLAALCAEFGILTVCDEVKVGLARTGMMHCFEHEGIAPDLVVFGKGLGGGLPVSAVVGPARVLDFAQSFSMQTLHGNPVCASAAKAVLDTMRREALADHARDVGAAMMEGLRALDLDRIGDVRGRGLAIGVELIEDAQKTPAANLARKTVYRAWELGAVFYYVGMSSNVLELTPPLTLSEAEAREGVEIIGQAIRDAAEGRVDDAKLAEFAGW